MAGWQEAIVNRTGAKQSRGTDAPRSKARAGVTPPASSTPHALLAKTSTPEVDGIGRPRAPTDRERQARRLAVEGTTLINRGRHARGAVLLTQSIALDPSKAASHHDLGIALIALGRIEEAVETFAAAARLDPELASAQHNLAFALDSIGRSEQAMAAYEAAVRLKPDLAAAQSRLGDLFLAAGRKSEAAAAFRAAAQARPASAWAMINEARARDAEGATNEAIAALRQIADDDPANADAHIYLGRMLAHTGESANAASHFEQAATLAPDMTLAWYAMATNRKFTSVDQPLIGRMNATISRPKITPLQRQVVHFALGKAHDDIADYRTAIRHFDAANRIRAKSGNFDGAALARRVDRIITGAPHGFASPAIGVDDPTPILIVGMPRSGTTLVEQILSSHAAVAAGGELPFWAQRDTVSADLPSVSGNGPERRPRERLSGPIADDLTQGSAGDRQDAVQLRAARRHSSHPSTGNLHPLPAPSDRHLPLDLHNKL